MNTTTKNNLILAIFLLLLSASTCLFFVYKINNQGTELNGYIKALDERQAQESSFMRMSKLVSETKNEQLAVASAFFTDEGNGITFLGEVEGLAASIGLELKTENLNKITGSDKKTEYLTMSFVYSGEKEQVLNFNKLLENIPYHSQVKSLSVRGSNDGKWESRLTLHIMIQSP